MREMMNRWRIKSATVRSEVVSKAIVKPNESEQAQENRLWGAYVGALAHIRKLQGAE
jgi:hypothetical protein